MPNDYFFLDNDNFMLSNTGQPWKGKGDGIFRTALFAMCHKDYKLLYECRRLLFIRRRWPKRLDSPDGIEHRNPWIMTRDPYVTFYAACKEMNRHEFIKCVKPPWYIWRPAFNLWRRYLITGNPKHKRQYERAVRWSKPFEKNKPMFAIFNAALMAWVAGSEYAIRVERERCPEWNLAVRQLTKHPDRIKDAKAIGEWKPRKGFWWQIDPRTTHGKHIFDNPEFLPEDQSYYLDRDTLDYFVARNYEKSWNQ